MALSPADPSSYARPDHVKTTHIHLGKHTFFSGIFFVQQIYLLLFKGSNKLGFKDKRPGLNSLGSKSLTKWENILPYTFHIGKTTYAATNTHSLFYHTV